MWRVLCETKHFPTHRLAYLLSFQFGSMKAKANFFDLQRQKSFFVHVDIHFGRVRMYAMPYPISRIIFILDSVPSYTDRLLEFRWVQIAPLSWLIYFFLYCYERDFMDSLNHDNQADVIEAFNSTSRYLDDLLNTDIPYS